MSATPVRFHAVVSLLDAEFAARIDALHDEITARFGLTGEKCRRNAHITYLTANDYDIPALETALQTLAAELPPFTAVCSGLSLFTMKKPILTIPVVRGPAIDRVHRAVWTALDGTSIAQNPSPLYIAEHWLPHMTLAYGEADAARIGQIVGELGARDFTWRMPIDNLALLYDSGDGQNYQVRLRVPLTGSA